MSIESLRLALGLTVLIVGCLLSLGLAIGQVGRMASRILKELLTCLAILAVALYARFGLLHFLPSQGQYFNFHQAESLVYYVGSKYYRETGQFDLYNCAAVAFAELKQEDPTKPWPEVPTVHNLRQKLTVLRLPESLPQLSTQCHARFSASRWSQFTHDLTTLVATEPSHPEWWNATLMDAGYNTSPVWTMIGGHLASLLPLEVWWRWLGYLDWLLLALAGVGIYRAFGRVPFLVVVILFGTNPMASYTWTGGCYLRHLWDILLALGLCSLAVRRFALAGVLLGWSATLTVFPAAFAVGAGLALVWEARHKGGTYTSLRQFLVGFVATVVVLSVASILCYGLHAWRDFCTNLLAHNRLFWVPHVGLKKAVVYFPGIGNRDFWEEAGMIRAAIWDDDLQHLLSERWWLYWPLACVATLSALVLARRLSPVTSALIVGGTLLYCFTMPAQYYYVYVPLFVVAFYRVPASTFEVLRLVAVYVMLIAITLFSVSAPDEIIRYESYSFTLGAFFFILLLLTAREQAAETGLHPPRKRYRFWRGQVWHRVTWHPENRDLFSVQQTLRTRVAKTIFIQTAPLPSRGDG